MPRLWRPPPPRRRPSRIRPARPRPAQDRATPPRRHRPASASDPMASYPRVAIVGGGPAGLMAAEVLAQAGAQIDLYDAMPSVGRKFLLAGRGGLNLTHSEPLEPFLSRYAERRGDLAPMVRAFTPQDLRDWTESLGVGTFVGSSGRVFPTEMKAAPMLRAWLQRLRGLGVRFHMRHRWQGWSDDGAGLHFQNPPPSL